MLNRNFASFILLLFSLVAFTCRNEEISPIDESSANINLIAPENNSSGGSIFQKLDWIHTFNNSQSVVFIAKDSGFNTIVYKYFTKEFSVQTDTLEMGVKYYWNVSVLSPLGKEYKSEIRSFSINGFNLNGEIRVTIKGLHKMEYNGSISSIKEMIFGIDCRNLVEYRRESSFTFTDNKLSGSYRYGSPVFTITTNANMLMDKRNFNIKSMEVNYNQYDSQTLRSLLKYTLILENIPISAINDTSIIYKIGGDDCSKHMAFFGDYHYDIYNMIYNSTDWAKDSYIMVELKK